jgi:beta-lactamase family protein
LPTLGSIPPLRSGTAAATSPRPSVHPVKRAPRSRRRGLAILSALLLAVLIVAPSGSGAASPAHGDPVKVWPRIVYPSAAAIRSAQQFAAGRGDVAFAVIDPYSGTRGYEVDRQYSSASVSKAMLLAAELRRLRDEDEPLDQATRDLLEPMVTYSDNQAADAIYAEVGDEGLEEVAERAGMTDFEATPGYWGGDQITAADIGRFFYGLDQNLSGRYHDYAKGLLARITPEERWGIPEVLGRGWAIWFKGGWRPLEQKETSGPVTHQAALLVNQSGERLALAVLTDELPGAGGGFSAITDVAGRLLSEPPPQRGGWPAP